MPHIIFNKLNVAYGSHEALKSVSVKIPNKQLTTIIGPSGCGKTTLLKSINRLIELNEDVRVKGEVLIDGKNVYSARADILELRKKVGFLSQRPYPLPMSIYDNVAFGPRIHRMTKEQIVAQLKKLGKHNSISTNIEKSLTEGRKEMDILVESYLKFAGLWDEVKGRLYSPAGKLSVGQQQRLALARALAIEPEIILADEPTSALDPISAQLIEKQFQLLKTKYTIIVVTHILRQAKRIADYTLFLYMGHLVEHGPAKKIFTSPSDQRTKAYISGEIS